jgi:hypothetical protein
VAVWQIFESINMIMIKSFYFQIPKDEEIEETLRKSVSLRSKRAAADSAGKSKEVCCLFSPFLCPQ